MLRILFLIFLTILSACNSSEDSADSDVSTPTINEPTKAPTTLNYKNQTASYFRDVSISPNTAVVNGDQETMRFSISPALPSGLSLNTQTGTISGMASALLEETFFLIKAENDFGLISTSISIKVLIPPPSNLQYLWTNAGQDVFNYINVTAQAPTVSGDVSSFCITPALQQGMVFDTSTGVISGQPQITDPSFLGRYYSHTVRAYNSTCPNANSTCSNSCGTNSYNFRIRYIEVAPSDLVYENSNPTYSVGVPILDNCPTYSGGFVSLFVVNPVSLPAGLNFNLLNGCIQGTPLAEVSSAISYSVTAINTGGQTQSGINIKVFSAPPTALSYSATNLDYTKGIVVSNSIIYSGGKPTNYIVDKPLPPGLTLNAITGVIEGIPTELRSRETFTITASNTGGSVQSTVTFGVKDKAPSGLAYSGSNFSVRKNEYFSAQIIQNTGGAVVSFGINPPLPAGLNFNSTTGAIDGTPSVESSLKSYTVMGSNTGGNYTFQFSLEIKPIPNYDFLYHLVAKEFTPPETVSYIFEVENRSREFDNSVGINLTMPFSASSTVSGFSTASVDSNCLNLSSFTYLQKCKLKINYIEPASVPAEILVNVSASTVITKVINLKDYLNISPINVTLTADRNRIIKANYNANQLNVDISNPVTLESVGGTVIPLVSQELAAGPSLDTSSTVNLLSTPLVPLDSPGSLIGDPDLDGLKGIKFFSNLQFTSAMLVTAQLGGYTSNCSIDLPYTVPGGCILGAFNVGGANLNYSGEFSVSIGVNEGLVQEKTKSNPIFVDVYQVNRIFTNNEAIKSLVVHNDKIYSPGVTDPNATNFDLVKKLLAFDPTARTLKQISNFSNPGNDQPVPLASYEGLLFFEARTPSTIDSSNPYLVYAYDDNQNKINPLFTKPITGSKISMARPSSSSENTGITETWAFVQNNKLFFNQKISDGPGFYNSVVSYSKINNLIRKEILPLEVESSPSNSFSGSVDKQNIVYFPSTASFYFNAHAKKNSAPTVNGFKLQALDSVQNKQSQISKKNMSNSNDYLEQITNYDNKLFFISRTPVSGLTDVNSLTSELIFYDPLTTEFKKIYQSSANGAGNIMGVFYGKLFFSMPISSTKSALYYYDGFSQEIEKIYESESGNRIFTISRYANFSNLSGFLFAEGAPNTTTVTSSKALFEVKQVGVDFEIRQVVNRSDVYFDETASLFSYRNTLFFSCGEGGNFKLNNLCAYYSSNNTFAFILTNLAPKISGDVIPGQRPGGIILYNNRIYFSGSTVNTANATERFGLFELCLLQETGCAP